MQSASGLRAVTTSGLSAAQARRKQNAERACDVANGRCTKQPRSRADASARTLTEGTNWHAQAAHARRRRGTLSSALPLPTCRVSLMRVFFGIKKKLPFYLFFLK